MTPTGDAQLNNAISQLARGMVAMSEFDFKHAGQLFEACEHSLKLVCVAENKVWPIA